MQRHAQLVDLLALVVVGARPRAERMDDRVKTLGLMIEALRAPARDYVRARRVAALEKPDAADIADQRNTVTLRCEVAIA
eukprot:6813091-Prymnesium_polylepis.2